MIQWSRVRELRDEIGAEDFGEVVELFLEEVNEVIARLKTGSERDHLEQDLHFLKGSALSLGFSSFSSLCQDGERLSVEGAADTVDLAGIFDCYEQSRAIFVAELDDRLAEA